MSDISNQMEQMISPHLLREDPHEDKEETPPRPSKSSDFPLAAELPVKEQPGSPVSITQEKNDISLFDNIGYLNESSKVIEGEAASIVSYKQEDDTIDLLIANTQEDA